MIEEPLQQHVRAFLSSPTGPRTANGNGVIALGTNVGLVRKQNEDCALVMQADFGPKDERSFVVAAVCDGLGGMARGSEASVLALSVFASRLIRTARMPLAERVEKAAEDANRGVYNQLGGKGGTTLSAVLIDFEERAIAVNAGDSRLYGITHPDRVEQLSRDDNLAALAGQPGQSHPAFSNRLIQFVGMGEGVEFHISRLPAPTSKAAYLLTSDGAHSINPEVFSLVVRYAGSGLDVVRRILTLSEWCGGKDNATAVYLPANFPGRDRSKSNGVLTLTLHSVSRSLDILIPTRNIFFEQELPHISAQPQSVPVTTDVDAGGTSKKKQRNPHRAADRKRKGRPKKERDAGTLPLDVDDSPRLEVSYPKKP